MVGRVNGGLLLLLLLVCVPPALDELLDEELPHSALGKDVDFVIGADGIIGSLLKSWRGFFASRELELIELRRETMADAGRCFSDPMLFEAGILGGAALALLKLDPPMPTTLKKPSSPPPSLSPLLFVAHKGGHTPLSLAALIGGGLAANDMPFAPPPTLYPACPCPPPPSPLPNKIAQTLRDNTSFSQPDDVNLDLC